MVSRGGAEAVVETMGRLPADAVSVVSARSFPFVVLHRRRREDVDVDLRELRLPYALVRREVKGEDYPERVNKH